MISTDSNTMTALIAYGHLRHPTSPARARSLAMRLASFIELVARFDRADLPMSRGTIARRVADCRSASIAPIGSPERLAELLVALNETNLPAALRLIWVLDGRHFRSAVNAPAEVLRLATEAEAMARLNCPSNELAA